MQPKFIQKGSTRASASGPEFTMACMNVHCREMYTVTEEEEEEEQEQLTRNCEVSSFHCFQLHHQPWLLPIILLLPQQTDQSFTRIVPALHQEAACLLASLLRAHLSLCLESESFCRVYQHRRFDSSGSSTLLTALNCQFLNENFQSTLLKQELCGETPPETLNIAGKTNRNRTLHYAKCLDL